MAAKILEKAELRVHFKRPGRRSPTDKELESIKWLCKEIRTSTRNMGRHTFDIMKYTGTHCEPYVKSLYVIEKRKNETLKNTLREMLSRL